MLAASLEEAIVIKPREGLVTYPMAIPAVHNESGTQTPGWIQRGTRNRYLFTILMWRFICIHEMAKMIEKLVGCRRMRRSTPRSKLLFVSTYASQRGQ